MVRSFSGALGLLLLGCVRVLAAAGEPSGHAVYEAGFYAPFTPQNALDMLQRTPGFVLDEGELVRGFAGGAGNVLIDGARPATKADGVAQVLRRIPASQVERVEVRRGGDLAGAPGQSSVANIVRRADGLAYKAAQRSNQRRGFDRAAFNHILRGACGHFHLFFGAQQDDVGQGGLHGITNTAATLAQTFADRLSLAQV